MAPTLPAAPVTWIGRSCEDLCALFGMDGTNVAAYPKTGPASLQLRSGSVLARLCLPQGHAERAHA